MQLSLTPAATPLAPKLQPIPEPTRLSVPSTGKAAPHASPRPGSLPATDVPVLDAVASATQQLGAVASASDAVAAASLLKGATKDILVAHRGALDVGISPALDKQLMGAATDLAKLALTVAKAPPSTPFTVGTPQPKAFTQATDVLAVLADHVARIDQQNASGVYL